MCCAPYQQDVLHLHCGSSTEWLLQVNASYGSTKWLVSPKFSNNPESNSIFMGAIILFGSSGVCPLLLPLCKSFKKLTFSAQSWILGFKRCFDVLRPLPTRCSTYAAVLLQNGCSKLMPAMDLQNGWCHQSSKATKNQNYIKASNKYSVFMHAIILFGSSGVCPLLLPLISFM